MKTIGVLASLALLSVLGCNRDNRRVDERATVPPSVGVPGGVPVMSEADRTLAQRVEEALRQDSALASAARNVQVHANGGEVTLRGSVSNQQEKTNLASKAQQVTGVTRVNNQLEVRSANR